jgi:hypothetical protein
MVQAPAAEARVFGWLVYVNRENQIEFYIL